ncbi:tetratricopeptide repeat protein [Methanobrevibacter sp.]|uniref:tetratricopeptide repeat protein n=1 Tax=Methanobrevibacter sp. TaxID=66852 RepID=UPI003865848A
MTGNREYLNTDIDKQNQNDKTYQATFKVSKTSKVEHLIKEQKYDEALAEINKILQSDNDYSNWNLKGIILDNLKEYEKAIEYFDKALNINESSDIKINKANSLYNWAKLSFFPEGNYDKALKLINCGLEVLGESEDPSEFYFLKAEILEGLNDLVEAQKAYLIAYKEFDRLKELENQIEYINNTSDILIIITGCSFYNFTPESGIIVSLVKDIENEHDPDAIAVMKDESIVGYVANSDYTLIEEVKSASDIKNIMNNEQKAEILFDYMGEYTIAKLI